jgi:heme exporter protein CcmD
MNWREFFYMGGYWPYVWASYALAFVVLALNVFLAWRRDRLARQRLAATLSRKRGPNV